MPIEAYTFDAASTSRYLELCRDLYRRDRRWIPPLERSVRAQFSPDFAFYRRAGNAHRHFLATAGGRPLGHVSAFVNADLRDLDGTPVGAVGFFECIDDYPVASDLLGAARAWLEAEHGRRRVWGPMKFDIWHGYRMMTHGFDTEIFFGEPYNQPYYAALFERAGFGVRKRWHSVEVAQREVLEAQIGPWAADWAQARADGYRLAPIDVRNPAHVLALHQAVEDSFRGFLGFAALTRAEFEGVFAGYAQALDPRLVLGAWRPDGALCGFAIAYPDQARALRAMRGSDALLARVRFLVHARRSRRAVFFMVGITAAELARGRGLARALGYQWVGSLLAAGYDSVVFALLAEDSPAWHLLPAPRERPAKTYALYEVDSAR